MNDVPYLLDAVGALPQKDMRSKVLRLEQSIREEIERGVPQPEWETKHYFAEGLYGRVMVHPPGMLVVGKVHKKENFFILMKGTIQIVLDDGVKEFTAPDILITKPGTKRVVLSQEGATYMTVHSTDKKTVEEVEKEVVEDDPQAQYTALNQPKLKELT